MAIEPLKQVGGSCCVPRRGVARGLMAIEPLKLDQCLFEVEGHVVARGLMAIEPLKQLPRQPAAVSPPTLQED